MYELSVEHEFCAAHAILINGHREPVHGHNWRVLIIVAGPTLDHNDLLCDFHVIERDIDAVISRFNNADLNSTPPFDRINPTAEARRAAHRRGSGQVVAFAREDAANHRQRGPRLQGQFRDERMSTTPTKTEASETPTKADARRHRRRPRRQRRCVGLARLGATRAARRRYLQPLPESRIAVARVQRSGAARRMIERTPLLERGAVPLDLRQQPGRVLHEAGRRTPPTARGWHSGSLRVDATPPATCSHPPAGCCCVQQAADSTQSGAARTAAGGRRPARLLGVEQGRERATQRWYRRNVFPILTPLAVDSGHRFPFISNLSESLGVMLRRTGETEQFFARVKVPLVVPQWCRLPTDAKTYRFVATADMIEANLSGLFSGMEIARCCRSA